MAEVEIEKKFLPTQEQLAVVIEGSQSLGGKQLEDSYLDTDDFRLTTHDFWFRLRDGVYELKAPIASTGGSSVTTNRYREITDTAEICEKLELNKSVDFEVALETAGIKKFMTVYTTRQIYENEGFHIDVDSATYANSDFTYAVMEIELLIDDEAQADEAERKIVEFAKKFGLVTDQVILGKVASFLKAENPAHYNLLVEAGVLK